MKKALILAVTVGMAAISITASAAPGDAAGSFYATDIVTSLNGYEIDSINIGGNTLISAEDMKYYSFNVFWDEDARALYVNQIQNAVNGAPPEVERSGLPSGTVIGSYYETDIVTYLDGEPIRAYNTDGRTYIHAEAMRAFGYDVIWDAETKTLDITSPNRIGKVYSLRLSDQQPDDSSDDGEGSMAFTYTPDHAVGRGDAKGCNITFGSDNGREMYIHLSYYSSDSPNYPAAMFQRMHDIAYTGNISKEYEPEDRFDDVSALTDIRINGQSSENMAVMQTQGNGHIDYIFIIKDLPVVRERDILSIEFVFGEPSSEEFELTRRDTVYREDDPYDIAETVRKYPNDFLQTYYETDEYCAIYICESPSLGVVTDRLYIYDKNTKQISDDVLEQVRCYEGFDHDILHPFAFEVRDVKTNLFFSCKPQDVSKDFYVDMKTNTVYER